MFRLQKVLEWKEVRERELRLERMTLERLRDDLEGELRSLVQARREMPDDVASLETAIDELAGWSSWAEGMRRRETHVRQRKRSLDPELAAKTREHLEIRREVEGLRKLAERERSKRKKARERKQQEQIDDVANRRRLPGPGMEFPRKGLGEPTPRRGTHRKADQNRQIAKIED